MTLTQGHDFKVKVTVHLHRNFLSGPYFLGVLFAQLHIWHKWFCGKTVCHDLGSRS